MQGTSDQQLAPRRQSKLMDTEDAAQYIGVTTRTLEVWRCTRRYCIPYLKVGRCVRYRQSELDAWLDSCAVGGNADAGSSA
jgi:excisionase family DNA binding protein